MSEKHRTTIDALQAVMVAACAHLSATGMCDNIDFDNYDPSLDSPYCGVEDCTLCALARACNSLPEEVKP